MIYADVTVNSSICGEVTYTHSFDIKIDVDSEHLTNYDKYLLMELDEYNLIELDNSLNLKSNSIRAK